MLGIFLYILFIRGIGYRESKSGIKNVSSTEAYDLLTSAKEIMIIDIRTPEEFSRGHLEGAVNIDYYAPDFNDMLGKLDKKNTYLVYCRTGSRSDKSLAVIKKLGFKNILHMYRGIAEWKNAGLPLGE